MKKWASSAISFLISGLLLYSWLNLPLWRDVRFQTGFDDTYVILPSGEHFKPGKWSKWPAGAPALVPPDGSYSASSLLMQEGFESPVIIRTQTGDYPARVTSIKTSGKAATWFIIPASPHSARP